MNGHDLESRDEALERRAREAFEASVGRLDAATTARLRAARHAAVAEMQSRRRPAWQRWSLPVAMAASAALVGVLLWRAPAEAPEPVAGPVPVAAMDAIEMVADDDLEMVTEDLEFYAWLEQAEPAGNPGGQG
jgi:hypothetical protein